MRFKINDGCEWRHFAAVRLIRFFAGDPDLLDHAAVFFAIAFAREGRFEAALFAGWNIEGVTFDFTNNIFLLHLTLEATESALERLIVAQLDFCH